MVNLPVEVVLLRVSEAGQAVAGLRCGCVVGHDWMFLGDSVWMREWDEQKVEASENKDRMQEKSTGSCFQLFFIKAEASTINVQALGLERRKRRDFLKTLQLCKTLFHPPTSSLDFLAPLRLLFLANSSCDR